MLPCGEDRQQPASPELGAGDLERLLTSSSSPASPCPPSPSHPHLTPQGLHATQAGVVRAAVGVGTPVLGGRAAGAPGHPAGGLGWGAPGSLNDVTVFCNQRSSIWLQAYSSPNNPAFTRVPNEASGATPGRCCWGCCR